MESMFAAATSLFNRTNIHQSYIIGSLIPTSSSSSSSSSISVPASSSLPITEPTPVFNVGPWKIQPGVHKTTNKRVSVWSFDKRSSELERSGAHNKEQIIEVLKAEATALGRLRHPSILGMPNNNMMIFFVTAENAPEMTEPLEETRSELVFATEPLLSVLSQSIPTGHRRQIMDLDEVEIQKGILQLCKGLEFLHNSAKLIHTNIAPENILINSKGDWKIGGLALTIPFLRPDGSPSKWEFPAYDARLMSHVQRSFDYMAPEYALDEQLTPASDMYSLGCVIYAVHNKGRPPSLNQNSLGRLRDNAGKPLTGTEQMDSSLRDLLSAIITRHPQSRPGPTILPTYPFFSSLAISTLNFLDRSTFASKTREEKIAFMKGLTGVLPTFSDGLRTRKILPSLIEEMKDTHLLPYILPNVFYISKTLSSLLFASAVLPSLKPLFSIKDPPQNMLTLLDNLTLLQEKTDKVTFKDRKIFFVSVHFFGAVNGIDVLPLVYNALESEHAMVQERALKIVPHLCDTIDYAEVQSVLFPRVALVFTKTRILSVKVQTLDCFVQMVKTLDQSSLTQKLVPLLSKIRTKVRFVSLSLSLLIIRLTERLCHRTCCYGTLAVQEAMGMKVDREAVATLVLPQLWAMSIGPLINLDQFQRFMKVIKALSERVEREHGQYLRDSHRIEDRSGAANRFPTSTNTSTAGMDFESLVSRDAGVGGGQTGQPGEVRMVTSDSDGKNSWDDDIWGSILADTPVHSPSATPAPVSNAGSQRPMFGLPMGTAGQTTSLPSSPSVSSFPGLRQPNTLGQMGGTRERSSPLSNSFKPANIGTLCTSPLGPGTADPSSPYWGTSAFNTDPANYKVFRNVKDYGAVGDGVTDDTDAINKAIADGNRCGLGQCDSSTLTPAVVYFPSGTYLVSSPIIAWYYTAIVGDAKNLPILLASHGFNGIAVIVIVDGTVVDADPFRSVRNFVIDLRGVHPLRVATGLHWQVSQATSLTNVWIRMSPKSEHKGIFMENGSGGYMGDIVIEGGKIGMDIGNQQQVDLPPTESPGNLVYLELGVDFPKTENYELCGGTRTIDHWIQGKHFEGHSKRGESIQDQLEPPYKPLTLLDSSGNIFGRTRPVYADYALEQIVSVKDLGAKGDGITDDTAALQRALDSYAGCKIIYFDAGTYIITDTLVIPSGSRVVGEIWTEIMGSGPVFNNIEKPKPVIRVGDPCSQGVLEISDMLFSTRGPASGAIVVEWNAADPAGQQGLTGMWDSHIRLGATLGSRLGAPECTRQGQSFQQCFAAFLALHLTPSSTGYFEGTWIWLGDHDLDNNHDQITVFSGRGLLSESKGPVWLIGTAEHHVLYQFNLVNARDHYMGLIQTETPYYQPIPPPPRPYHVRADWNDPKYYDKAAWALRIVHSQNILLYGAGFYSFFQDYDTVCIESTTADCQQQIVTIDSVSSVTILNLATVGTTYQLTVDGIETVLASQNKNGFSSMLTSWSPLPKRKQFCSKNWYTEMVVFPTIDPRWNDVYV
ncbi:hypothetical protein Clacol_006536 [Clathrus columnatus]|uniref:Protein kinase domain-containing protein n=1 Tax=Clathrus columnatus TaxID=1419009 RepID=A0AAV5AK10_9AGAM|nr:hypothetical protein Clacol_006536 [Clathrus columnatus]